MLWVHAQADIEHDEQGNSVRLLGTVVDITEHKRAEAALKENEERLKLGLLGAGAAIWDWDLQNNKIYVSDLFLEMSGYIREEYGDDPAKGFARVHPEDLALVEKQNDDYFKRKIDGHPASRY